jgi:hypothetical protein
MYNSIYRGYYGCVHPLKSIERSKTSSTSSPDALRHPPPALSVERLPFSLWYPYDANHLVQIFPVAHVHFLFSHSSLI